MHPNLKISPKPSSARTSHKTQKLVSRNFLKKRAVFLMGLVGCIAISNFAADKPVDRMASLFGEAKCWLLVAQDVKADVLAKELYGSANATYGLAKEAQKSENLPKAEELILQAAAQARQAGLGARIKQAEMDIAEAKKAGAEKGANKLLRSAEDNLSKAVAGMKAEEFSKASKAYLNVMGYASQAAIDARAARTAVADRNVSAGGGGKINGGWGSFRGIHLLAPPKKDYELFKRMIKDVLPVCKCNTLVLEVDYFYEFKSHPEVIQKREDRDTLTHEQAVEIADLCRQNGIRLIPAMNLLGHQSADKGAAPAGLLKAYPEFDETPDVESGKLPYCRSLCPRHLKVETVVFDLIDELADVFKCDAFHVGLDEVVEIGKCPRCKGTSQEDLFAEWTKVLYEHIVKTKKLEMLMWHDMIRPDLYPTAANKLPKDIILCVWLYSPKGTHGNIEQGRYGYRDVTFFLSKGYRVVACPWRLMDATRDLVDFTAAYRTENAKGVLCTNWNKPGLLARYLVTGNKEGLDPDSTLGAADSFKWVMSYFAEGNFSSQPRSSTE